MDIYLFNWTNPLDYNNHSIKPNFEEVGPYRFQEIPQKVNVTWHDNNSTVSYRKQSRYFFVADQSKGKLEDVITSVNVIALVSFFSLNTKRFLMNNSHSLQSSAVQAQSMNIIKLQGVAIALSFYSQKLHITKTASQWLFEGYEDPIIDVAKGIASILGVGDVPFDRFGWFYMVSVRLK